LPTPATRAPRNRKVIGKTSSSRLDKDLIGSANLLLESEAQTHFQQQGVSAVSFPSTVCRAVALGILTGALGLGTASAGQPPVIKIFDAPGAGNTPGTQQGTLGVGINGFGVIAGSTRDNNGVRHGFLRYPNGKFVVFDHPLAGTDGTNLEGTLNALGAVAGSVRTAVNVGVPFVDIPYVREPDGTFHNVNFPNFGGGDGNAINLWGVMVSINDLGAITGDYWTCNADLSSCAVHGFVRTPDGKYSSFDVPGASTDGLDGGGTFPQGINDLGEVSGYYVDANFVFHGFVRSPDGRITTFDVRTSCTDTPNPPADCALEGTFPANVNVLGRVGGTYYGEDGNPHGFWRDADGTITRFDYPRENYFTEPTAINDSGQITGLVYDPNLVVHGLLVTP
jgi:hypothetical protein